MKFAIIGSGFTGAVIAYQLAKSIDCKIIVFDERDHLAGNCYTSRDPETKIIEHHYGPHIFHTSDLKIWKFVNKFAKFVPFTNRVKAITPSGFYGLPINLTTINQFFNKTFRPNEAIRFIESISDKNIDIPANFEEQALKLVGKEIYENFFFGYTKKQWGVEPRELPASILKRLPIRFNCDDNYYSSTFQGIPMEGYTPIIGNLLNSPKIELKLKHRIDRSIIHDFDHVFFTGPIDSFYHFKYGNLGYRTVFFERLKESGDYQGNPVINYTSFDIPYTRIAEHKHFTPWEEHRDTLFFKEYSKFASAKDIPYYPIRRENDLKIYQKYEAEACNELNVSFIGRLATYRYLDMHVAIKEALDFSNLILEEIKNKRPLSRFQKKNFHD